MWNSSDESVAKIDENGRILLKGTGDVIIEARLYTGAGGSFKLHVYDSFTDEKKKPEKLGGPSELSLSAGEDKQIKVLAEPLLSDCDLICQSENESIASVDYFGVVHGIKQGETTVTVHDVSDENCRFTLKVIVH